MHVHMTFTETTTKHNYTNWDSEVSHETFVICIPVDSLLGVNTGEHYIDVSAAFFFFFFFGRRHF